ncbi:MAG: hypothetical protein NZ930_07885 [Candidatus Bipolaricaulota bacterium]|nr:hypothetical protein [Candidatus Bipolaricaulota bacterium]MDW8031771.1 hypothetical protein [Candidatus Bipolaricaulota bacterium]
MPRKLSLLVVGVVMLGWPRAQPPEISGPWAHLQVMSSITNAPVIGTVNLKTITILRLEVTQRGTDLSIVFEPCAVESESSSPFFRVIFPEAFVKYMGVDTKPARLESTGGGWQLFQPRYTIVRGARLQNPDKDPLPTDPNDPRVFDQDRDGKPGVTIRVNVLGFIEGEIYIVQRDWNSLRSTIINPMIIDGLMEWGSEQVVLGASNPLLAGQAESSPDPKKENSYFRTTRIEPNTTCEQILKNRDKLFAR